MHRRQLLRSLALAGLGASAAACGLQDAGGERAAPRGEGEGTGTDGTRPGASTGPGGGSDGGAVDGPRQDAEQAPRDDGPDDGPAQEPEERPQEADEAQEAPTRVEVLCREAVGLAPADATSSRHQLDRLTLHHSAVRLDAVSDAPERLRRHQRHHQDQGWADIAYHYAVDLAGNVYELRDPAVPGDTFTDYDTTGHLHVVCEGDFEAQRPTDALLDGLGGLLAALADTHGLSLGSLEPHRTYVPTTACPGRHLRSRVDELRARASELARTRPPRLELRCGDEARQRVAAIEAG